MPSFPLALASPLWGSYSTKGPTKATVRTAMEVGPPKVRRRSSLALTTIEASYALTEADLVTVETWYRNDLALGATTFDWDDPRTGTTRAVRFAEDGYSIEQLAPTRWVLKMSLEEWA